MMAGFRKALDRKLAKRSTLKYGLTRSRTGGKLWTAEIIGPFHHRLYGTCAMASTSDTAVQRLKAKLQLEGWLGTIVFSDADEADWHKRTLPSVSDKAQEVIGTFFRQ